MVDVNERALDSGKNASRNGVGYRSFSSDVYEAVVVFGHVISNPPIRAGKKVVHQ